MHTVTKSYTDLPAAHRQPNHSGHCRLIHGHNWRFDITFAANRLDRCGFVLDVGSLRILRDFLGSLLDHKLLLNEEDPRLEYFRKCLDSPENPFSEILVVPNCGMEGLAEFVFDTASGWIASGTIGSVDDNRERSLRVTRVVCYEDSKNWATYDGP